MMKSRTLFWSLWILGTISQAFGFLFAQVPQIASYFLGGVLLVTCGLLASSVVVGRAAWMSAPVEGVARLHPQVITPLERIVVVIALIQLCLCLYWLVDLVIYAFRR